MGITEPAVLPFFHVTPDESRSFNHPVLPEADTLQHEMRWFMTQYPAISPPKIALILSGSIW